MNIAYYSHYFTPEIGAPSARIYDLARQWLKSGHQVQVVTGFPNHPTGRLYPGYQHRRYLCERLDGIEVHRHWTYVTPNKGFAKKTLGHFSYLLGAEFISNRHLRRPDVAIGTSPTLFAASAAARFAEKQRIPFIMEIRDLWPAIFVELGVIKNVHLIRSLEHWEMSLYRRASKVVVVTEAFREKLLQRGLSSEKLATIPNGADIDFWRPQEPASEIRHELNLEGRFVVLYIGAHGISHALERILESAQELGDSPEVHFLFVGEGAEKERLIQRAKQMELSNVTFVDSVGKDKVREFYALADVCLVPLKNVPLFATFIPSKMFEMMSMARPIVASLCGEAAEILRRSKGAVVVEPENSRSLAEAIRRLYQLGKEAREAMGRRGREFVKAHYSRSALSAAYIEVMNEAVREYRRR